jgi:hypothetical protein
VSEPASSPQAAASVSVAAPPPAADSAPTQASIPGPTSAPVPAHAQPNGASAAPAGADRADGASVAGFVPPHAPEPGFTHLPGQGADPAHPTCTQAQLRRFIKSRPWVPMHELRRRFGIDGVDDDVSPIRVRDQTLFIGLPMSEGRMMAELLGGGDVGYELSLDPVTPVVVGVYPMRPVPRS